MIELHKLKPSGRIIGQISASTAIEYNNGRIKIEYQSGEAAIILHFNNSDTANLIAAIQAINEDDKLPLPEVVIINH